MVGLVFDDVPLWWNGLHVRLKNGFSKGIVGSNPTSGTIEKLDFIYHWSIEVLLLARREPEARILAPADVDGQHRGWGDPKVTPSFFAFNAPKVIYVCISSFAKLDQPGVCNQHRSDRRDE